MFNRIKAFVFSNVTEKAEQKNDRFLEMVLTDPKESTFSSDGYDGIGYSKADQILRNYLNHRQKYGLRFDASQLEQQALRLGHPTRVNSKLDFAGLQFPTKKKPIKSIKKPLKKKKKVKRPNKKLTLNQTKRFQRVKLISPPQIFNIRNKLVVTTHKDKNINKTTNVKKLKKYKKVLKALKKNMSKLREITLGNSSDISSRESSARWLDVYDIVEYETRPFCTSSPRPLRSLIGSCYSERNCARLGGLAVDHCAYGYGVCCICKILFLFKRN